jgi:hypothetical protein
LGFDRLFGDRKSYFRILPGLKADVLEKVLALLSEGFPGVFAPLLDINEVVAAVGVKVID